MSKLPQAPAPKPSHIVPGHSCPCCGAPMRSVDGKRMYCSDAGQDCQAKNKLFDIGYKGV
jgi:hypothetical protein